MIFAHSRKISNTSNDNHECSAEKELFKVTSFIEATQLYMQNDAALDIVYAPIFIIFFGDTLSLCLSLDRYFTICIFRYVYSILRTCI